MILITGLTGKSGTAFLEAMARDSYKGKIRVVVRKTSNIEKLISSGLNYELAVGDIKDENFLIKCLDGCDTVFHIASKAEIGVVASAVVKSKDVKHCFIVSSTSIFSNYRDASDKLIAAENEMKKAFAIKGVNWTIIRPTMIYGTINDNNISTFMKWLDKYPLFPIVKNGEALLQPVYKDDIGDAYYLLLVNKEHVENKEYIVSGERAISLKECLETISKSLGRKVLLINVPMPIAVLIVKFLYKVTFGKFDYREKLFRLTENRSFDHNEISWCFGYKPRSFELGVHELTKEYKSSLKGVCVQGNKI